MVVPVSWENGDQQHSYKWPKATLNKKVCGSKSVIFVILSLFRPLCQLENEMRLYRTVAEVRQLGSPFSQRGPHSSGIGTIAAVATLAATLFRPKINIHNLLYNK